MTWDDSAADVSSMVIRVEMKTANDSAISISGLPKPFNLYIPRKKPKPEPPSNSTFLKKRVGTMAYHRFNWTLEQMPLYIILKPNSSKAVMEVYITEKERPKVKKDPLYWTIPDMSKCKTDSLGAQTCDVDAYSFPVNKSVVKTSGVYYIGLMLKSFEEDEETLSRERRDCGTGKYRTLGSRCLMVTACYAITRTRIINFANRHRKGFIFTSVQVHEKYIN